MTVSMSTATIRSTTVRPMTSRMMLIRMASPIRPPASLTMVSAKDLLQMALERARQRLRGDFDIGRADVEPVDQKGLFIQLQDQRARRERDRVGKRQPADRRAQSGAHPHDAGPDRQA